MGQAYTPGLKVSRRMTHRVRRLLPVKGEVLVKAGDRVDAQQVVARTYLPGDVTPVNLANILQLPPADLLPCMLKKEGERIAVDEPMAQTKGMFGMFKSVHRSKYAGTIETISDVTGQVIIRGEPIPVEVKAYLSGRVAEVVEGEGCVVEAEVTFVQGIFGVGGETYGPVRMAAKDPKQELVADLIQPDMKGAVVVGGARVWHEAVVKARAVGVAAIVAGGIDDRDLSKVLGYDLGVAITGHENLGITLVLTEGFGDIAMADRTFALLKEREGAAASVNGATQIRAGVMRPEVAIPLPADAAAAAGERAHEAGALELGRIVRIIRDPYFGLIGEVAALPPEPQALASGSKARVLTVKLPSGEQVTVPRANIELIET